MIYISNALYLASLETLGKKPFLGWHSIVQKAQLSATSEAADRPIENIWNPDTSQSWEAAGTGTIYINVDNPSGLPVNYLGLAKHNLGSAGVEFTLQESDDNATWTDVFSAQVVSTDRAIMHYFDSANGLYFRLKLSAPTTAPIIAHMKLGEAMILERPMYVGISPPTLSPKAKRIVNGSESGQYLGQVVTRRWYETSCKQENCDPAWIRANLTDFIDHTQISGSDGTAKGTFFYAWRPADYPNEVIYGWTDDDIAPTNQRSNGMMQYNFNIQGVL